MNYIDKLLEEKIYPNEIVRLFYLFPMTKQELLSYGEQLRTAYSKLIDVLEAVSIETIVDIIEANRDLIGEITPANIPQFSNLMSINDVLDFVDSTDDITFELIGYYINKDAKKGAQVKYGENHYKTAAAMGLVYSEKPFGITELGKQYMRLPKEKQLSLRNKLFLQIPIVQTIIVEAKNHKVAPTDILREYLSESTSIRRRSNVRALVEHACKEANAEFMVEIQNNLEWK